ncbi:hypothetical protein [Streptomyces rapamycinicus]|uniref:hypothetical protein n=1 Tax=Streptomyces rapamycinicus TaxID=1226757 RepID=UPI0032D9546D
MARAAGVGRAARLTAGVGGALFGSGGPAAVLRPVVARVGGGPLRALLAASPAVRPTAALGVAVPRARTGPPPGAVVAFAIPARPAAAPPYCEPPGPASAGWSPVDDRARCGPWPRPSVSPRPRPYGRPPCGRRRTRLGPVRPTTACGRAVVGATGTRRVASGSTGCGPVVLGGVRVAAAGRPWAVARPRAAARAGSALVGSRAAPLGPDRRLRPRVRSLRRVRAVAGSSYGWSPGPRACGPRPRPAASPRAPGAAPAPGLHSSSFRWP